MPQPISIEGLRNYQSTVAEQRKKTRGTLQSMGARLKQLNSAFDKQSQDLMQAQGAVIEDAHKAYDNLNTISRIPEKIGRVIGMFDTDFNREVQMRELERSSLSLNSIGNRMQLAQQRHAMATDAALQEGRIESSILQFDREGFIDQTAMMELGWRLEDRITQDTARMAENAGIDNLRKWLADPSSAPKELQDKRGLLELAYTQAMSRELNVSIAQVGLSGQLINNARLQREEALSNMTTNELQNGFSQPPEGLSQEHLVAEIRRREAREIDAQMSAMSLKEGKIELAQAAKGRVLMSSSMNELTQLGMAAQENGGRVQIGELTITGEEIRQTMVAKTLQDQEQQTKINEYVLATTGFEGMQVQTAAIAQSVHQIMNPGVPFDPENPYAGLPDDMQATLATGMQQMEVFAQMGSPGGMVMVNQKMNEQLDTLRKEVVDNLPKEVQPAAREYMSNSDMPQIRTPQSAAAYLSANSANPMMMSYDPTWSGVWSQFSKELTRLQSENQSLNVEDMNIESAVIASLVGGDSSKKDKNYILAEQAIQNTGLRDVAANQMFERLLGDTIQELMGENEGNSPWAGLYNAGSGKFHQAAYEMGDTSVKFSKDKWNDLLAQRTIVLHNNGTLPTDTTLHDLLYERMQGNIGRVRQYVGNDMATAALNNVLFANRPENAIAQRISDFSGQQERFAALEQARLDAQEVKRIQGMEAQAETAESNATTKLARQAAGAARSRANYQLEQLSPQARALYDYMEQSDAAVQ